MKMIDMLGLAPVKGEIGIEIEVEGVGLPMNDMKMWRVDVDGSLRGESAEYVLIRPFPRESVPTALKFFKKRMKGVPVIDSGRSGIHIHVNIQELSERELVQFITLYLVFEQTLVKWCGRQRTANLFCLQTKDASELLEKIREAARRSCWAKLNNEVRYGSINTKAISEYGSVEFRAMRSTTDIQTIQEWIDVLLRVKDSALAFDSPADIIETFSREGFARMYDQVIAPLDVAYDEDDIMEGLRNAQYVAYARDNWEAPLRVYNIKSDIQRAAVLAPEMRLFNLEAEVDPQQGDVL